MVEKIFKSILLEKEQEELLTELVKASRNVKHNKRQKFMTVQTSEHSFVKVIHPGLSKDFEGAYIGDLEILAQQNLLNLSSIPHGFNFDVTPLGIRYYKYLKQQTGEPIRQIEQEVHAYIDSEVFHKKYLKAFEKWREAESLLWQADTDRKPTLIGHLCRESMQEFATSLIEEVQPPEVDSNKAHTIARLKAVLKHLPHIGSTEKPFLDALIAYCGTVNDLIQRQEHGAKQEKEFLVLEDARRVVFHTMLVMYEIDRAVTRS